MWRRILAYAIIVAGLLPLVPAAHAERSAQGTRRGKSGKRTPVAALRPGPALERELAGGRVHRYRIAVAGGQLVRIVVDQKGIDVVVTVLTPDGAQLLQVDSPNGDQGPEPVALVTERPGAYLLEVRSLEPAAKPGRYAARVVETRPATPSDTTRLAAAAAHSAAESLLGAGDEPSVRKALEKYRESAYLSRSIGDAAEEASAILGMAQVYFALRDRQKTFERLDEAIGIAQRAGNRVLEADLFNTKGAIYNALGDQRQAVEQFARTLAIGREIKDDRLQAYALINSGSAYMFMTEYQEALDALNAALRIFRSYGERGRVGELRTLANLGAVYMQIGDFEKAQEIAQGVALRFHEIGDSGNELAQVINLGTIHTYRKEWRKALARYETALTLARGLGDRDTVPTILVSMANALGALGDYDTAIRTLEEALEGYKATSQLSNQMGVFINLGEVYLHKGDPAKALEFFATARRIEAETKSGLRGVEPIFGTARAEADLGRVAEAKAHFEEALGLLEATRKRLTDPGQRATYFARAQEYFEAYRDFLMHLNRSEPSGGHAAAAFLVVERARARSLLDLLAEANVDTEAGVDPALVERSRTLGSAVAEKAAEQTRLGLGGAAPEEIEAASHALDELMRELDDVKARIRRQNPKYAALLRPAPVGIEEVRRELLDEETALLEYSLGEERSYVWCAARSGFAVYELPGRPEIEDAAREFYGLLTARNERHAGEDDGAKVARVAAADERLPGVARRLGQMLLGPATQYLSAKRLLISADGMLHYVPFSALVDPTSSAMLAAAHEIVMAPSATVAVVMHEDATRRSRSTRAPKAVAIVADPVFSSDDERVKTIAKTSDNRSPATPDREIVLSNAAAEAVPRLAGTRIEADRIAALVPQEERLELLDFSANRDEVTGPSLANYRIVHFATHGYVDTSRAALSALVLSLVDASGAPRNGYLRVKDVFDLHLPAELVVLSACKTGVGRNVTGEGLIGLTQGFLFAGAARVTVSLWNIDDEATAEMMTSFYGAMLRDGLRPAEALRKAQLALARSDRWRSPYFWAPFVFQGEWSAGSVAPTLPAPAVTGPRIASVEVSDDEIEIKGDGFVAPVVVTVNGIGFAKPAKLEKHGSTVVQKGDLVDGRSLEDLGKLGKTLTVVVRNCDGGEASTTSAPKP